MYDINQQTTDDIRVLKSEAFLEPIDLVKEYGDYSKFIGSEIYLPLDYLHLLNCVCIFKLLENKNCWDEGDIIEIPAIRLTSDSWSLVMTDIYNRPTPLRPYYYLHNVNIQNSLPTNPIRDSEKEINTGNNYEGTDATYLPKYSINKEGEAIVPGNNYILDLSKLNKCHIGVKTEGITSNDKEITGSKILGKEKESGSRLANSSNVRCEIRYGNDKKVFQLIGVNIDYLKSPQHIRFTQNQLDSIEDTSQIMEFPDYVNQEITNELVQAIMAHVNDPRLATTVLMNQSIARPTLQLEQNK